MVSNTIKVSKGSRGLGCGLYKAHRASTPLWHFQITTCCDVHCPCNWKVYKAGDLLYMHSFIRSICSMWTMHWLYYALYKHALPLAANTHFCHLCLWIDVAEEEADGKDWWILIRNASICPQRQLSPISKRNAHGVCYITNNYQMSAKSPRPPLFSFASLFSITGLHGAGQIR